MDSKLLSCLPRWLRFEAIAPAQTVQDFEKQQHLCATCNSACPRWSAYVRIYMEVDQDTLTPAGIGTPTTTVSCLAARGNVAMIVGYSLNVSLMTACRYGRDRHVFQSISVNLIQETEL